MGHRKFGRSSMFVRNIFMCDTCIAKPPCLASATAGFEGGICGCAWCMWAVREGQSKATRVCP